MTTVYITFKFIKESTTSNESKKAREVSATFWCPICCCDIVQLFQICARRLLCCHVVCLLLNPWICFDTAALALTLLLIFRAERQGSLKQGLARLNATSTFPIMHFLCPRPKFCITFVFHFSPVLQLSQEKLKTMFMQNFGGAKKVH